MKRTVRIMLPVFTAILLVVYGMNFVSAAEGFSVREYKEFHDVLHPLEHEALPKGDFKTIRARAAELTRLGEAIIKLGVPANVKQEHTEDFKQELKRFSGALSQFKTDAETGTDAQLKDSYSAVHDSFEMLAALLPPAKRGSQE